MSTPACSRLIAVECLRVCGEIFFADSDGQFLAAIAWYFVRRARMASGDSGLPWRVQNKGTSGLVPRSASQSRSAATVDGSRGV